MAYTHFLLLLFLLGTTAVYAAVVLYLRHERYDRSAAVVGATYLVALALVLHRLYR